MTATLRRLLPEDAKQGQGLRIVDLGSGTGRLCMRLGRAFPKAEVIGYEVSVIPWFWAVLRRKLRRRRNVVFLRQNFWAVDCGGFDVVVLFLTGNVMERMGRKLRQELKPGALVIANDEPLQGDWEACETVPAGFLRSKLYVYRQTTRDSD